KLFRTELLYHFICVRVLTRHVHYQITIAPEDITVLIRSQGVKSRSPESLVKSAAAAAGTLAGYGIPAGHQPSPERC
ncbi:MAG TPA: hypothetical protein PLR25_07615, partial [Planctomycetaceae bacterium]|nr:hypothetical protein [Planctomycetaceae bacterium]